MRNSAFLPIALAVFLGATAAWQLNRFIDARKDAAEPIAWRESSRLIPTLDPSETSAPNSPNDFRAAAKKVIPSVVSVDQYNRNLSWFDSTDELRETGSGSGVIISKNGIIVTNNHVVEVPGDVNHSIGEQVKVRLPDKRTFIAKVIGRDRRSDLAVLKIEANDLQPIEIGNSSKLEIGQWVIAVGNPLGFDNTVSVGVVSSLGRTLGLENSVLLDGIQTDAAINPGNSGGALTDASGDLVGINSAIASENGGSVGIGFAIPVNTVRRVVDQIVKYGYAKYGNLGVNYASRSLDVLQSADGRRQLSDMVGADPPDHGLILTTVAPDSAAGHAGLQRLDILLSIDGQRLDDTLDYNKAMGSKQPGDTVEIGYWSHGSTHNVKIKLDEVRGD